MRVEILRPYFLLLIPVFLFLFIGSKRWLPLAVIKKRVLLVIRNIIAILLILALAGVNLTWNLKQTTNIFLVDLSSSAKHYKQDAEAFIREAYKKMPKEEEAGVLVFGRNALVDRFVSPNKNFYQIASMPNEDSTNIQVALASAIAHLPQERSKRIILISDGEENEGEAEKLISTIRDQNIDFKVLKINRENKEEVYVDYLSVPDSIHIGESFNVIVNIKSNVVTDTKLTLYSGRSKRGEIHVELQKGDNRFVFKETGEESGLKSYRVVIEPSNDTEVKNNEYTTFTRVQNKPRVLLIEGISGEGEEIEQLLRASGLEYIKTNTAGAPRTLGEMMEYKSIILANVHADDLNDTFKNHLPTYIRDYAGGLIVTGGENSYILGGYRDTPIEEVLPVTMDLQGEKEIPEMSMVLVIDQSGSMSDGNGYMNNLDLAKESAIKALDTLRSKDYIGVLAFDHTYEWVVEVQKAEDKNAIQESIQGIMIQGGTSIYPALEQAYLAQKENTAKIRHIILLTDGQDGFRQYETLLEKMNEDNITLSTVSIGEGADRYTLEYLAEEGKGRNYHTDITTNIPRIFANEIFLSVKEYVNNRPFYLVVTNHHAILSGVQLEEIPLLYGYIGTSPKQNSTVVLKSDEDDPILVAWQYGLGRTMAWTSDMAGRWSSEYVHWNQNLLFWQNALNWIIENYSNEGQNAQVKVEGTKAIIQYKTNQFDTNVQVTAISTDENGNQKVIPLEPIKPGEYSNTFQLDGPGFYTVNVREELNGEVIGYDNTAMVMQYSPEYRFSQNNRLLEYMVEETNGLFVEKPEDLYQGNIKAVKTMFDLTNLFLILAMLLFFLDIAFRRLNIDYGKYYKKVSNKIQEQRVFRKEKKAVISKEKDIIRKSNRKNEKIPKEKLSKKEKYSREKEKVMTTTSTLLEKKKDRN